MSALENVFNLPDANNCRAATLGCLKNNAIAVLPFILFIEVFNTVNLTSNVSCLVNHSAVCLTNVNQSSLSNQTEMVPTLTK